jgi:hypothetical protein
MFFTSLFCAFRRAYQRNVLDKNALLPGLLMANQTQLKLVQYEVGM